MKYRNHGVLLQSLSSHSPFEIAGCRAGALLTDIPALNVPMEGLRTHVQHLLDGFMPVGSVEHLRWCGPRLLGGAHCRKIPEANGAAATCRSTQALGSSPGALKL